MTYDRDGAKQFTPITWHVSASKVYPKQYMILHFHLSWMFEK